jgi:flavin-dependent dehydrogenase
VRLEGVPPAVGGVTEARCIRRTALDKLLVDAAVEAGVVVEDSFVVKGLIAGDHGVAGIRGYSRSQGDQQITARIVIGADGMRSSVARIAGAETYRVVDSLTFCYYSYWSGTGLTDAIQHASEGRLVLAFPTNDDLTLVSVSGHRCAFGDFRADVEGSFQSAVAHVPELAERLAAGRREERFFGTADLPNFYRQSSGAGWALVGDAAFHRDPVTGQGISDAFDDAEAVAQAVHRGLAGAEPMESALARCQAERDIRTRSVWEYALKIASLGADEATPYKQAAAKDPDEVTRIFGVYGGAIPHWEVFTPDNVKRVLAGAALAWAGTSR